MSRITLTTATSERTRVAKVVARVNVLTLVVVAGSFGMCLQRQTHDGGVQETSATDASPGSIRRNLARDEEDRDAIRQLFITGDQAVPSLVDVLRDPGTDLRTRAARGLAYIGDERGIKALEAAMDAEEDRETRSAMTCFYAGGLVQAKSGKDRELLKDLIERAAAAKNPGYDDDAAPAVNAALALAVTGRSDSLPALQKFKQLRLVDTDEIAKAIRWIERKHGIEPAPTGSVSSEEELVRRFVLTDTFFGQSDGDETSVERLTFNRPRTKVLVSLKITGRHYARGYDLVLAKAGDVWKVTGVWFTWIT